MSVDHAHHPLHAHKRGDAQQGHAKAVVTQRGLWIALVLTLSFSIIELFAGVFAGSLALISDAGHMVTDAAALGLALLAQYIARRPPSPKHSFGFGRSEALAAFVNCIVMLGLVGWIIAEAISRFFTLHEVSGATVTLVAALGLVVNVLIAWFLSRGHKNVNTRAALVHVMGDLLASLAALVSGLVIQFTGWMEIDPLLSIFVSLLILKSTLSILRESYHFLMEGVPLHIDYVKVGADLQTIKGIQAVHDLHVWEMTPTYPALIGHVEIESMSEWPRILDEVNAMLLKKYRIDHVTIQPEEAGKQDFIIPTKTAPLDRRGYTEYVECASSDGLHRMAYHSWGDPRNPRILFCVHGLSRRGSDFATLAEAMCDSHYVVCPDVVGRGDSDWFTNPMLYVVPQYVSDMVTLVAHLNATKIDWFGTSMGGLIGMVYASMQGNPIQRLLLNDVGPRLEPDAIKRLSSYVGKPFLYADRQTALEALNNICQPFGQHSTSEWEKLNGPMLEQTGQGWILHYDPNIVIPFSAITPALAVAGEYAMWKAFEQIQCPVLVVRGANSDLLSTKTVEEMSRRAPHVRSIEIPNVGHAPAFIQPEQIQIAREFFRIG